MPSSEDIAIRLFSLAFPEEWAAYSEFFYNADGSINKEAYVKIFTTPSMRRDWAHMPDTLARLAGHYKPWEMSAFVRDTATLFAGLADRLHASWVSALRGGQVIQNAYLGSSGLPAALNSGSDLDANVHHWAAFLATGYYTTILAGLGSAPVGSGSAVALNVARELKQWSQQGYLAADDINLGNRGAYLGAALAITPLLTPGVVLSWYALTMLPPY